MSSENLNRAKTAKNDRFFTQMADIDAELKHYANYFRGKVVFCNCDDVGSNFWNYFHKNFVSLGLKRLVAVHYEPSGSSFATEYCGGNDDDFKAGTMIPLEGNGDFRSPECVELLEEADVVATNPPFSLFREYVAQLMDYGKKFIIIGNMNCIAYKEIFPLIKNNRLRAGVNEKGGSRKGNSLSFEVSDGYDGRTVVENGRRVAQISAWWFTNLDAPKRHEPIELTALYSPDRYPKYDNYDAINVDKTLDIPMDYDKVMGVPISFLDKYCPEQFEIIGMSASWDESEEMQNIKLSEKHRHIPIIKGKEMYWRILIRRKRDFHMNVSRGRKGSTYCRKTERRFRPCTKSPKFPFIRECS